MIRVLLVDDHPALRAGLQSVLRTEPGLVPVGEASSASDALGRVSRDEPDVLVADYQLPDESGLKLCWRVKSAPDPPAVLIYSAYADTRLAIPALVAGADGLANKGAPAEELFEAIRRVARGMQVLPPPAREELETNAAKLDPERQIPVFGMLMDRTTASEIADVLGLSGPDAMARIESVIDALELDLWGGAGRSTERT